MTSEFRFSQERSNQIRWYFGAHAEYPKSSYASAGIATIEKMAGDAADGLRDRFCDCPGHGLADDQHSPDGCLGLTISHALRALLDAAPAGGAE